MHTDPPLYNSMRPSPPVIASPVVDKAKCGFDVSTVCGKTRGENLMRMIYTMPRRSGHQLYISPLRHTASRGIPAGTCRARRRGAHEGWPKARTMPRRWVPQAPVPQLGLKPCLVTLNKRWITRLLDKLNWFMHQDGRLYPLSSL